MKKRQQTPTVLIKDIEDKRYYHHMLMYQDPAFIRAIEELRSTLERKHGKGVTLSLFQLKRLYSESFTDEKLFSDISHEFATDDWGIEYFANGHYEAHEPFAPPAIDVKRVGDRIAISVPADVTKEQLINVWPIIEAHKHWITGKVASKAKPPAYPDLIYAVFRGLRSGLSMAEIHSLIESERLPLYRGKPLRQYGTPEDLRRYYDKYKPA